MGDESSGKDPEEATMRSPDLDPELAKGLLEALAQWDQSETVAFSHEYMKRGDEAALQAWDALGMSNPVIPGMLEDRYLSPSPDLAYLKTLPDDTLGREFERYFTAAGLDVDMVRESAFIEAHKRRGDDVGYVAERGYQLHDLFHVLTGYDTSPLGEIRVVSFTVAQTPAPYPALTIAMRLLQSSLYRPELLPLLLDATAEGWALGRRAKPLISVHWEDYWERPLVELRAEFDLA